MKKKKRKKGLEEKREDEREERERRRILSELDCVTQCRMAIALAFFPHTARKTGDESKGLYRGYLDTDVGNRATWLHIHPSSPLKLLQPKWVVYQDLIYTSKAFMRNLCSIEFGWVQHLLPRLRGANVQRLCGNQLADDQGEAEAEAKAIQETMTPSFFKKPAKEPEPKEKLTGLAKHADALARYKERKAAKLATAGKK